MADIVRLRGHHLLCLLTYIGEGYTPQSTDRMTDIAARIEKGATILIVSGIDEICGALWEGSQATCGHAHECRIERVRHRDALALKDVGRILQMPMLKAGDTLVLKKGEIRHMRHFFTRGAIRHACTRCAWHNLCSTVAANKFAGVKLFPAAIPRP